MPSTKQRIFPPFLLNSFVLLTLVSLAVFAIVSCITTAIYPPYYAETIWFIFSTTPACLLSILALPLLAYVFTHHQKTQKRLFYSTKTLTTVVLSFHFIFGCFWVLSMRTGIFADARMVQTAAEGLWNGQYDLFGALSYMMQHPYQTGLCFFDAIFFAIFGFENLLAFQLCNVLCSTLSIWILCKISDLLFPDAARWMRLFALGATPLLLNATFIYGNTISLPFNFAAIFFAIRATHTSGKEHLKHYTLCAFAIAIAKLLKPNSLIFLIGILLFLLAHAYEKKSYCPVVAAAFIYGTTFLLGESALFLAELLTGGDLHSSQPMISWVAMGLQDGPLGHGWFNQYVDSQYVLHQGDASAITADAIQSLRNNILNFLRSPGYTLEFFSFKVFSQWCEPTFGGLWVSYTPAENAMRAPFLNHFFAGDFHACFRLLLDICQSLVYAFAALGLFFNRKRWTITKLFPILIMMGGFAYSIVCEAKSMYVLPYYLLLFPYAAIGLSATLTRITPRLDGFFAKINSSPK